MKKNPTKKYFRPTKNFGQLFFRQNFSDFFRRKFFDQYVFGSPIPIPNDPKIPKITLRTAYGHYKNTNSAHEKKLFFFALFTVRPRPGRTRFVNLLSNSTGRHCTHQRRGRTEQNNSVGCFVASRPCSGGTLLVLAERP